MYRSTTKVLLQTPMSKIKVNILSSINNAQPSQAGMAQSNSFDAIAAFGGGQDDDLQEQVRAKRPNAESAETTGRPQINY